MAVGLALPAAAQAVPTGMHYEMVSPVDSNGQSIIGVEGISPDGNRVALVSPPGLGFGGTPSQAQIKNGYLAMRGPAGWQTTPMNPPATEIGAGDFSAVDRSSDLSSYLFMGATEAMFARGQATFFMTRPGEPMRTTLPAIDNFNGIFDKPGLVQYKGASADFGHVLISSFAGRRLLPGDPPAGTIGIGLYEQVGTGTGTATFRRVDVDTQGAPMAPQCQDNNFGSAPDAISANGSRIFFTARPASAQSSTACQTGNTQLYARVDGTQTVQVSTSECARVDCLVFGAAANFVGASVDGSRVFFTSTDQLTDQDTDFFSSDLYMYDFDRPEGSRLTMVSAGDATAATPGSGANVGGIVQISDDGSRVYFVARSVLTTDANGLHQTARAGADNLYLYEPDSDTTKFVATLADQSKDKSLYGTPDQSPSQLADPAGRFLVFTSYAGIAPGDDDGTQDVYRYDADTGTLVRVSSGAGDANLGVTGVSAPTQAPLVRRISTDGSRILFSTASALQAGDENQAADVYLWTRGGSDSTGTIEMVSDGHDPYGVSLGQISQDGSMVAFVTTRQLVAEDQNEISDLYVARTGPDVSHAPTGELAPCVGDACQGPTVVPPALSTAGSRLFSGPGNVPATPEGTAGKKGSVSVSRVRTVRGRATKVKVRVSGAGRIRVSGSGLRRASKTAKKAGTYRVKVTLSQRAQRTLRRKHRVKVRITVRFTPKMGRSAVKRVHATFRLKKQHHRAARSRVGR